MNALISFTATLWIVINIFAGAAYAHYLNYDMVKFADLLTWKRILLLILSLPVGLIPIIAFYFIDKLSE